MSTCLRAVIVAGGIAACIVIGSGCAVTRIGKASVASPDGKEIVCIEKTWRVALGTDLNIFKGTSAQTGALGAAVKGAVEGLK